MTMLKQDSRPMSNTSYAGSNDLRLRNNPNPRSRTSIDSPPSSPNQAADRRTRSCCFSCCLRNDAPSRSRQSKPEPAPAPRPVDDLQPTAEDVRLWGESFENVMNSASGRKCFRDFLRCEYSEENILFWLACEDLKRETNPETVEEKARIIYEDYISILSPKEVSLDSRVREIINRNMVEPSRATFDEAQLQIFTLMHRDSYPRFVNSDQYKTLVKTLLKPSQKQNNSGASTGSAPQSSSSNSHIRTSIS